MRLITILCLLLLQPELHSASNLWGGLGSVFGGSSSKKQKTRGSYRKQSNSEMRLYPYIGYFKGFEFSQGLMLSWDIMESGTNSRNSFNLAYSSPEIKGFTNMEMTQYKLEYENRTFDTPGSYYSAALGIQSLSPNLSLKNFYAARGESVTKRFKPYLSLRMGYKVLPSVPVVNTPAVLQLSYTLSDDYRFPSHGPHGYRKIPLKGFGAAVEFKF